jgi:outer membrane protein assembly factor BamB
MKVLIFVWILISLNIFTQQQTEIPWPTLADSPWPMIKHDPQFTGRSPYKGPQTPTVIWTADMTNGIFSGPVIGADDNLYFGSYFQDPFNQGLSDTFYSYFPTGQMRWAYKLGSSKPPQSGILIDSGGTIYFGSLDKYLYSLTSNGTLKWKYQTSSMIEEIIIPNIDLEGNIYLTNYAGLLYSISPTGGKNWELFYESGFNDKSVAIAPDGKTLYIPGRDSNLYAINLNGTIKWKFSCGIIHKAPLIDNVGNLYFTPKAGPQYLYSLTPNADVRWKFFIHDLGPGGDIYSSPPAIGYNGNIYFIGYDSTFYFALFAVNYNGNFCWKYLLDDEESDDFWQPLICDNEGTIYFGSTHGYNYYAIANDGILKWKLPLQFPIKQVDNTGAITRDGTLYIGVHGTSLGTGYTKTLYAIKDTNAVGLNNDPEPLVIEYSLEQNYPNPFNPSTKIRYSLKTEGNVNLNIYDIKGELISKLVNEKQQAGSYEVDFSLPENISTGVYIYRLTVSENNLHNVIFADVKKMVYLK